MSVPSPGATDGGDEEVLPERLRNHLDGAFDIHGEVGRGGMATVWRATRRTDQADVAIKVMRPTLAEAVGARRFLREIQIAGNTRSEFLVPLEESGEFDGLPYYVMPFIEGESLRQRLQRERQLPVAEAVRIARAIGVALAALHRDGIVHRDVKPENVLLRGGRDVLVADYGIARAVSGIAAEQITSTGIVLGTPAYMSPEQAGGETVDARSDQYSWGCLTYEMLLGHPPFHGASSQAVIARHMRDTAPSLRIVRPTIPESLEAVIRRTLEKVPADRFEGIDAMIAALDRVDLTDLTVSVKSATRWRRAAIGIAAAAAFVTAGWSAWRWTHPVLDPGRVALFPLVAADSARAQEARQVSIMVRSALEDIEPSRWFDGASVLAPSEQGVQLDARRAASLTRDARARYYVDGTILHRPGPTRDSDSVRVSVSLRDLEGGRDTTIVANGTAATVSDVALGAVVGLLPRLTGLERQVNVASLAGRRPIAVSNWLRGEREYRNSRMRPALDHLRRAVADDPALAPAALRAAMAAMWLNDERAAGEFVVAAQRHHDALTARQSAFAEALRLYLVGDADSAVIAVRRALALDDAWPEPWMLAGEVFLHLIPAVALDSQLVRAVPPPTTWPLEGWAEEAFRKALSLDAGFTPPLPHLAQAAARRGDLASLTAHEDRLRASGADSSSLAVLALARRCLGSDPVDWARVAGSAVRVAFEFGVVMSGAADARARRCGADAFASVLSSDAGPNTEDWGSLVGLFSAHVAGGDNGAALALVDSAVAGGMTAALGLYVLGAAASVDPGARADAFVAQLDAAVDTRPAPSLWLLALWSARTNDTARLARAQARLETLKSQGGSRLDTLMSGVVTAYRALARHDTTTALRAFAALSPRAPTSAVQSILWESLAPERLVHARLLLATGAWAAAHRIASTFDQPGIYVNPLFVRPSLEVRAAAARAMGDERLAQAAESRLGRPASRAQR